MASWHRVRVSIRPPKGNNLIKRIEFGLLANLQFRALV